MFCMVFSHRVPHPDEPPVEQLYVPFPSHLQARFTYPCRKKPQAGFKPEEPLVFQGGLKDATALETATYRHL